MRQPSGEIIIQGDGRQTFMARQLEAIGERDAARAAEWKRAKLAAMPWNWGKWLEKEHGRRGGLASQAANLWLVGVTAAAGGKLPLSATDADIRAAAIEAADTAHEKALQETTIEGIGRCLVQHCAAWGIAPPSQSGDPGLARMLCHRWYLRRLRRAHAKRAEGAAIAGGVVRRGLWPYASQDAVQRRQDQRKRNAAAMEKAIAEAADGERVKMADIVAGSLANPENKRAELMVRIRGADGYAVLNDWSCEFWTMTTPSRYHSRRLSVGVVEANPNYDQSTPRDSQGWLCRVWSRARAAWKRRGLQVAGLRTAEPHHDGTPHWHLIAYGPARDLRFARRLLHIYLMRDSGSEKGARKHRFNSKKAEAGKGAAAYAAAYVSKNIDGGGMDGDFDGEAGRKVSEACRRVDAWASSWGIRQFQFFGMPPVGIWRALRRADQCVLPANCALQRARSCADDSDWCGFWLACGRGVLSLVKEGAGRLTEYGDAAAAVVVGVAEGARRAIIKARQWRILWGDAGRKRAFEFPRSCVNNCTRGDLWGEAVEALLAFG